MKTVRWSSLRELMIVLAVKGTDSRLPWRRRNKGPLRRLQQ